MSAEPKDDLWVVVDMDEGCFGPFETRRKAVEALGFCTPVRREGGNGYYEYVGDGGCAVVARISMARRAGADVTTIRPSWNQ